VAAMPPHAVWSASRPLLLSGSNHDPFAISRTFDCFDHNVRDGIEGLVTLIGGKATTMRAMAEQTADLIDRKTGRNIVCRTRKTVLLPYRCYWQKEV
jgi:glycerol-3-phosphate dehydrogenase